MTELKQRYVIYLVDVDPDTGTVSQMLPVAYVETEDYAREITALLNSSDYDEPSRTYKYTEL